MDLVSFGVSYETVKTMYYKLVGDPVYMGREVKKHS